MVQVLLAFVYFAINFTISWIFLGTMKAAVQLLSSAKAEILEGVVVLELVDLKGRMQVPVDVFSLIPASG